MHLSHGFTRSAVGSGRGHRSVALVPAGRRRRDGHRGRRAVLGHPVRGVPWPGPAGGGGRHPVAAPFRPHAADDARRRRVQTARRRPAQRPGRRPRRGEPAHRPRHRHGVRRVPALARHMAGAAPGQHVPGGPPRGPVHAAAGTRRAASRRCSTPAGSTWRSPPGAARTPRCSGSGCSASRSASPSGGHRLAGRGTSGTTPASTWPTRATSPSWRCRPTSLLRKQAQDLCERRGLPAHRSHSSGSTCPRCAASSAAGLGVAIVPAPHPGDGDVAPGPLRCRPVIDATAVREIGLAWSTERRLLPAAELFRRHVVQTAATRRLPD